MVQGPYLGIALWLFALAVLVWLFHLPPVINTREADDAHHRFADALKHRRVWLGMAAIFLYVGAEVSIGSFMINYLSFPQIGDMSEARAAGFVSLYWGGAMVGRFIGAGLLTRVDTRRLLATFATIAGLLVLTTMLSAGHVAMWSVIAIGLFNSVMFPNIFTLGIEKFGALTGKVSSLLVMAIVGGAVIPLAQGALADRIGVQHAFVLPLACYAYIVFYGLRGSRVPEPSVPAAEGQVHA
jgi:FHS family L-fucose permease-like MFS transporter